MRELIHVTTKMRRRLEMKPTPFAVGYQPCFMCGGTGCSFCHEHGKVLFSHDAPIKMYRLRGLRVVRPAWALASLAAHNANISASLVQKSEQVDAQVSASRSLIEANGDLRERLTKSNRILRNLGWASLGYAIVTMAVIYHIAAKH